MGGEFSKMKKMLDQFQTIQKQLEEMEVEGTAGGGMVKIYLSGTKDLKKIMINKECVNPEDVEGLQDLILAAYHNAAEELEKNKDIGGSLNSLLK
jgi:DNA-binding YbaB/EbfC family protein